MLENDNDQNNVPEADGPSEKELFFSALEIEDAEKRLIWLKEACGKNEGLHQRLEGLLAAEATTGMNFLKPNEDRLGEVVAEIGHELDTEVTPLGSDRDLSEKPGDTIGRYKLLQKLGEGGGGVVYLSQQNEPVKRQVALKIIKLGMDTREVVARFEAERQALAMMDHPNIAKVFDAGATGGGRPYFVMELVKGVPITSFCDENKLSTKERLNLFMQVCEAVQHAHQKGIIHRDIKPGNVLVTMMEDRPVPKVIDFGIAKATQQELTEKTIFTQHGHFIGTPAYMSPEQASLTGYDIDTRSDIYALGVLLYELLTGKTPFDATQLFKAGYDEIRRVIAEDEPPKPSTRISSMAGGEITGIARLRKSEPRRLSRIVHGDLDWIVMKALEKDRRRRYETASGFALDLQRHLDDKPVLAGAPSTNYRLAKFVRRNRRSLLSGLAACAALLIGLSVAGGLWFKESQRASRVEETVDSQLLEARELMEENAATENYLDDRAFRRASELTQRAAELLDSTDHPDEALQARRLELQEMVEAEERGRAFIAAIEEAEMNEGYMMGESAETAQSDTAKEIERAFTEFRLDPLTQPAAETAESINRHRESLKNFVLVGLQSWSNALDESQPGQAARLEAIIERADEDPWRRKLRAAIKAKDGAALEALSGSPGLIGQPSQIFLGISSAMAEQQLAGPVEKILRRAQAENPTDFWPNFILGMTLTSAFDREAGDDLRDMDVPLSDVNFEYKEAKLVRETTPTRPELYEAIGFLRVAVTARPDSKIAWVALGGTLAGSGHLDEAIAIYRKAASLHQHSPILDMVMGMALLSKGKYEEAIPFLQRSADQDDNSGSTRLQLGMTLLQLGRYQEGRTEMLRAVEQIAKNPKNSGERIKKNQIVGVNSEIDEAYVSLSIASIQMLKGELLDSLESCRIHLEEYPGDVRAIFIRGHCLLQMKELVAAEITIKQAIDLGPRTQGALNIYGTILMESGRSKEALPYLKEALTLDSPPPDEEDSKAQVLLNLGTCLMNLERFPEAEEALKEALKLNSRYTMAWNNLGNYYDQLGDKKEAIKCLEKALEIDPAYPSANRLIMSLYWTDGEYDKSIAASRRLNEPDDYRLMGEMLFQKEMVKESIDSYQRAIALNPDLAEAHHGLGSAYLTGARYEQGLASLKTTVQLAPEMAWAHHKIFQIHWMRSEFEESMTAMMEVLSLESDVPFSMQNTLSCLLASGRPSAAQLMHGPCGDSNCAIDGFGKADQQLVAMFREGKQTSPEFQRGVKHLSREVISFLKSVNVLPPPGIEDLQATWKDQRDEVLKQLGSATVRIILLRKISVNPEKTEASQKALADELLTQLTNGANFGALAEQYSEGNERGKVQPKGDFSESLKETILSLKVGEFTKEVIEGPQAFYLLKVESRIPATADNFEDEGVEEAAKAILAAQQSKRWEQHYLKLLHAPEPDLITAKVWNFVGERLFKKGKVEQAKELFEKALAPIKAALGADARATRKVEKNLARCTSRPEKPVAEAPAAELEELDPDEAKSIDEARKVVDALRKRAQPDDDKLVRAMLELGLAHRNAGQFKEALETLRETEKLAGKLHPGAHPTVAGCLYHLGETLQQQGHYQEAGAKLEKALTMQQKLGLKDTSIAMVHNALGLAYGRMGDFTKEEKHLRRALDLRIGVWGKNHESVALSLNNLALNLDNRGDSVGAKRKYLEALKVNRDPATLSNLGSALTTLGEFDEARKVLEEAIKLLEQREDFPSRLMLSTAWNNLAMVFLKEGQNEKAKSLLEKALKQHLDLVGPGHPAQGMMLSNLGGLLSGEEAVKMQERALKLVRDRVGIDRDHYNVFLCLNNLALALASSGNFQKAETRAKESLAMARRLHPDEPHELLAASLIALAQIQLDMVKLVEAETNAREAVAMARKVFGAAHPSLAICLSSYSKILRESGRAEEADPLLREALKMKRELFGPADPRLAEGIAELGDHLTFIDKNKEAERLLQEALRLQKEHFGDKHIGTAKTLYSLGRALGNLDQIPEAIATFREIITILKDHPQSESLLASTFGELGWLQYKDRKPVEAEKSIREALGVFDRIPNPEAVMVAGSLHCLGLALADQGKHAEVGAELRKAIDLLTKAGSEKTPLMTKIMSSLANHLSAQGKPAEALKAHRSVLELRRDIHGPEHLGVASALFELAMELQKQGKLKEAEGFYRQALAMRRKLWGGSHHEVVVSLNRLAVVLLRQSKLPEAEKYAREALAMLPEVATIDDESRAGIMNTLGQILTAQAKFPEAERVLRESVNLITKIRGEKHPQVAAAHKALADVLLLQGKHAQAEEHAQKAFDMMIELLGANHPVTLVCLSSLAEVYGAQEKYDQTVDAYRRILKSMEPQLGPNHPDVSIILNNLGKSLWAQDKFVEAEKVLRRSLGIQKDKLGFENPASQFALARVLRDQGKFEESDRLFQGVLVSFENTYEPNHPNTAKTLIGYASSLEKQQKFADAKPLAERTLAIQKKSLPPKHPDLEDTYIVLSKIATGLENKEDAAKYKKLAEDLKR